MQDKPWDWLGTPGEGRGLPQGRLAQVLVHRFPADAVVTGENDFRYATAGALDQFGRSFRCQGLFPSLAGAALLGQGDAFTLAFPDQGPLEFSESPHDREHEVGHRGVLTGEDELFFEELHPHSAPGEALDECAQVIEVAGEPVHAVHDDGVPVADEPEQLGQLRPGGVLAGGFVGEDPVQDLAVELALLVLVNGADPYVADALTFHGGLPFVGM